MKPKPRWRLVPALALLTAGCVATPARRVDVTPARSPQTVGLHLRVRSDSGAPPSGDQVVAGWMGSVLGGFLAWRAFDEPNGRHTRVKDDWGYTPRALTALAAGSYVGTTLGVWWRGKVNGSKGSVVMTAAGAALPTVAVFALNDDPLLMLKVVIAFAPLQSAMGYAGYRMSTRVRSTGQPEDVIAARDFSRPRRSENVITRDELRRAGYSNAYDAVRYLRPQWAATARLRSPGEREFAGESGLIVVYLDGTRLGSTEDLIQVPLIEVDEIQYFDAREATNRFGTGHPAGAINVRRVMTSP